MKWVVLVSAIAVLSACVRPTGGSSSFAAKSAGSVGCVPGDITVSEESSMGWAPEITNTWVAECAGQRFMCTEVVRSGGSNVTCNEAMGEKAQRDVDSLAPDKNKAGAPDGAAGFEFGAPIDRSRSTCEGAGHTWRRISGDIYGCSGTAQSLAFTASTAVEFCEGYACEIRIVHKPGSAWVDAASTLKATLEDKYGSKFENRVLANSECSTDDEFLRCLQDGTVQMRYIWKWPTREEVELRLKAPEPELDGETEPSIRIIYSKPNAVRKLDSSGL